MSSTSSTDELRLGPGMEVAGFRLERELGRGARARVYEATQMALDRRVALKLLPAGQALGTALRWPEHPRVVRLYAAGSWEEGRFVAMQLVPGPTLRGLLDEGGLAPAAALDLLADVASALDAAHREGIAHGRLTARNVLVGGDGRALLSDFELGAGTATAGADRAAFARLLGECLGDVRLPVGDPEPRSAAEMVSTAREALPRPSRRRPAVPVVALCSIVAIALAVALASRGALDRVPPVERGARALGSTLAPGASSAVDCDGRRPSGASPACTVVQLGLPGRPLVVPGPGDIRRWVVRGARGELALQVIRTRRYGDDPVARSPFARVPDERVHALRADLAVRAGDRLGVQVAPGAAIGVRRGGPRAATARWIGPLLLVARRADLGPGTGFDRELLLRVDYAPGPAPRPPGLLTGRAARLAPRGRALASRPVEVRGGLRRVVVVALPQAIALDLFAGRRRVARVPVGDADPAGRLLYLTGTYATPTVRWRNPDGRTVSHEYGVAAGALSPRS